MNLITKFFEVLPASQKRAIYTKFNAELANKQFKKLPIVYLKQENVQNCQLVCNRVELLKKLPKGGKVAEVGVYQGDYAQEILDVTKPEELILIDSWEGMFESSKAVVEEKFEKEINDDTIKVIKSDSLEALKTFEDGYFDWMYLDSDHSYEYTKKELKLAAQKVKPGGLICGHDYSKGVWEAWWIRFGVIEAVNEFCLEEGYEFAFLTLDKGGFYSYGLRKIS